MVVDGIAVPVRERERVGIAIKIDLSPLNWSKDIEDHDCHGLLRVRGRLWGLGLWWASDAEPLTKQ
jgi:hypothetical protein